MDRSHRPALLSPFIRGPEPIVNISEDNWTVSARLPTGETLAVHLCGATVISWKNANGSENLWLSEKAVLDGSKAIRGGIPVVFPVFGPPPPAPHATSSLPQHGFARTARWEYLGKTTSESTPGKSAMDSSVKLDFGLYSSALPAKTREQWPYEFGLVYSVTLSPDSMTTTCNVRNEGDKAFEFQILLHSYFRIQDISTTTITGLSGVEYVDKVLNATTHTQASNEIKIEGEVDRVYTKIPQNTTTILEKGTPRFDVVRDKLVDTVLWNPAKEKAAGMGDFEPKDGWKNMVCVEVGAVGGWTSLEGGEEWEGGQTVKALLGY